VKDIKTEGTWTAIQVEFLNMRILDKWMLISIVFSGDGEVPAHDFPVETFFFPFAFASSRAVYHQSALDLSTGIIRRSFQMGCSPLFN
jgi:hypothetical protein